MLWWVGEMADWYWFVLLFTCGNEHYVCTTAHHPLMMACIYTNTQTCTYTAHTVYLYTYCTHAHMHICMCLVNIWVRPHHCDQPVGFRGQLNPTTVWFIISKVHWESWWDCENVALFPFSYFSRYVHVFLLLFWKPLYGCIVCNVTNICCVYLAFSSFTLLLKAACDLFFSLFLWSDAFYQSNRLAAVFEWPGPHTHTSQTVQTQINAQTIRGREMDGGKGTICGFLGQSSLERWHLLCLRAPLLSTVLLSSLSC